VPTCADARVPHVVGLLAVEDLFVFGIGLDVAGAFILARGLLASPAVISRRAVARYDLSAPDAVAFARDKVNALSGIAALVTGFLVQALAHVLALGLSPSEGGNWRRAGVALGFGVAGVVLALVVWFMLRRRWVKRVLVNVARYDSDGSWHKWPDAERLRIFGHELGYAVEPDERTPAAARKYAMRVFGVCDVRPARQHFIPSYRSPLERRT
jgi:hypothetical protein